MFWGGGVLRVCVCVGGGRRCDCHIAVDQGRLANGQVPACMLLFWTAPTADCTWLSAQGPSPGALQLSQCSGRAGPFLPPFLPPFLCRARKENIKLSTLLRQRYNVNVLSVARFFLFGRSVQGLGID